MLRLDDGTVIQITSRPAQGTWHSVLLGRERASGAAVVLKIELVQGTLKTERLALKWVSAHGGPVPEVRAPSRVRLPDGPPTACLVIDHADGRAPESEEGWGRLGRALAALAGLPWDGSYLTVLDAAAFGNAHARRIHDLCEPLRQAMTGVDDWDRLSSSRVPSPVPLVVTHGDPGPGNFLDNGLTGTLIDWEEAHVTPRGLDLGRVIALLGAGPAGYVARDLQARSRSVAAGYLAGLGDCWQPGRDELRWWLTVAGVQFSHRRWERAGQPGILPWSDTIAVLAAALRDDERWMPS